MTSPEVTLRTIEQRVHIAARPETVWSFWTDAARLCEWWGIEAEVEAEPDGLFRVVMGADGPIMRGRYVELQPFKRLSFTFGWENNAPGEPLAPGSTTVEVILNGVGNDTELILRHSELPAGHTDVHAEGWAHFVGERLPAAAQRSAGGADR